MPPPPITTRPCARGLALPPGSDRATTITQAPPATARTTTITPATSTPLTSTTTRAPDPPSAAEALYPVAMASSLLISIFGPLRAEMTLPCKAAHKLPCVLLPGLLVMGILAGI